MAVIKEIASLVSLQKFGRYFALESTNPQADNVANDPCLGSSIEDTIQQSLSIKSKWHHRIRQGQGVLWSIFLMTDLNKAPPSKKQEEEEERNIFLFRELILENTKVLI